MTMTLPEMEVAINQQRSRIEELEGKILQRPVRIGRDTGGGGIVGIALVRPTPPAELSGREVSITFLARPQDTSIVPSNDSIKAWCGPYGFTAKDFLMFEWAGSGVTFPYTLPVDESINALLVFRIAGETVIWWFPPVDLLPDNVQNLPHSDAFLDIPGGGVQFGEDP